MYKCTCTFNFTAALFELLMKMVSQYNLEDSKVAKELSSMASSCLLSLVIALGETDKLLCAISALLVVPPEVSQGMVKVCVYMITCVLHVLYIVCISVETETPSLLQ